MGDLVVNKKGAAVGRTMRSAEGRIILAESSVAAWNLGLGAACPSPPSLGVMTWGNDEFPTYYKLLVRCLSVCDELACKRSGQRANGQCRIMFIKSQSCGQ